MTRVIVPLTIVVLAFLAFVIWRVQVGRRERRREEYQRQREREAWADRLVDEP